MSKEELMRLSAIDITTILINDLEDISDIDINSDMPIADRVKSYFRDIKNPYCFKVNGIPVKINFGNHNESLEDGLYRYFTRKIDNDINEC